MDTSISLRSRVFAFYETLIKTLPPRTVSDRTCFRRITAWLQHEIESGRYSEELLRQVLVYASEARGAECRNHHAVFVSILKKELHYDASKKTS